MSHPSTHDHPQPGPGRGPLTRLLDGLTPLARRRGPERPARGAPPAPHAPGAPPAPHGPGAPRAPHPPGAPRAPHPPGAPPAPGAPTAPAAPGSRVTPGSPAASGPRGAFDTPGVPTAVRAPDVETVRPPVLTPAWQDWAERRRAEVVPTPPPGRDDRPGPGPRNSVPAPPPAPTAPRDAGAVRPGGPWAAVRLDDGRTVTVTSTVLLGRDPAARAGETPGALLTVADPQRSVSKTHLAVGVDGGGAWVVDRSSTNGTVVTLPDGARILCVPERRVRVVPGASVAFGDAALTLTAVARHAGDEESTP